VRTRRWLAPILLGCASVVAACGVDTSSTADRADDVPFGLLDPGEGSRAASVDQGTTVDLYLPDGSNRRLVRLATAVESAELVDVVMALQQRAVVAGSPGGNPLAGAEVIRSVDLSRGIATVDVSESFADLNSTDQLLALAEIVYTATARPGVGQVVFTLEDEPIEIPRGDGSLSSNAVTRADYPTWAPEV
jgi:hypothetical protein